MKLEIVDDPDVLIKAIAALDENETYSISAIDISFWKDGVEVEPNFPVEVTWESADIAAKESEIVHIDDDGKAEKITDAEVSEAKAVFTATSFSTYTTTRKDKITVDDMTGYIVMNPSNLQLKEFSSGSIEKTHPEYDGYTFKNATLVINGEENTIDPVVYIGAFIYKEEGQTDEEATVYIYYRTESTAQDSDLIVRLAAEEQIKLNYDRTPFSVTYIVNYNGSSYTIGEDELPADLADMVVTGPDAVSANTSYDQEVAVSLPRGYSATVRMSNESSNQAPALGEGSEPTYSSTDGWTVTPDNYPFTINGQYTISNVTSDLTVTINVTKRSSYVFNARPAFSTAYFGNGSRYTTSQQLRYTFNGNSTTFTFTTAAEQRIEWALDAFNINKQMINVPYVNASKRTAVTETTLLSGTKITMTATYHSGTAGRLATRTYEVKVENCYENITITGGNLHNLRDKQEWVLQETTNIDKFDYLADDWTPLKLGEPMSFASENYNAGYYQVGSLPDPTAQGTHYYQSNWWGGGSYQRADSTHPATHYHWDGGTIYLPRVIRFKVKDGYINPQIRYLTSSDEDQYTRVGDVTLDDAVTDNEYHLVTSEPDADGYYYFSLKGTETDPGLVSVRAELARYGVSYSAGEGEDVPSDPVIPGFDNGGTYGDGSLRGYNAEDHDYIGLNKSTPVDPSREYIFLYYTIAGDTSADPAHYAPSQKIPLSSVAQYGTYDASQGEYIIPFVAHWKKLDPSGDALPITVEVYLDDEHEDTISTNVPKGASVYIDIDSETMKEIMDKYNWQLFYDEVGSDPFIDEVKEDNANVEIRLYSKFYVYHSATDTLELHTTKELETGEGANRTIGTLNLAALTTEGYYYGGYYKDYLGAHVGNTASGKNLVKEAADLNNDEGTLTTDDILALSDGQAVGISEYEGGTQYDPVNNAAHLAYWTRTNAFTTALKSSTTDWFGDRGSKDTGVLKTGGPGSAVKVARAGIYYLHEVPADYLASPVVSVVKGDSGDGDIKSMNFLSVVDVNIYRSGGISIDGTDKKGVFTKNYSIIQYDSSTGSHETTATVNADDLFDVNGYLTVTSGSDYIKNGTYVLNPYWVTYDNVVVRSTAVGEGHVRELTVNGNVVD